MKNMLKGTNGTHFSARLLRSTAVAITGVALGFALWTATAPISVAQERFAAADARSKACRGPDNG